MLVSLLLAVMLQPTVAAQLKPGEPFRIAFDHEGGPGIKYRLWCNGSIVKNYGDAELTRSGLSVEADAPPLPKGAHSCLVSAYDEFGEAKSDPITIPVGTPTGPPTSLRIVITIAK